MQRSVITMLIAVTAAYLLFIVGSVIWTESRKEIAAFLGCIREISKEGASSHSQFMGLLALGMCGLLLLGAIAILRGGFSSRE